MSKRKYLAIALSLLLALSVICLVACDKADGIEVTFYGYGEAQTVSKDGTVTPPQVSLGVGQTLLGWATTANAIKAKVSGSSLTYEQLSDLATDGKLTLYPVIETKVELTLKGVEDKTTNLSDLTLNSAELPLVRETSRQQFLGWALSEGATKADVVIGANATINYDTVKDLADEAKLTLYPVVESYDLMIVVHASHSNGNVYVSDAQFATLQSELSVALDAYKAANNITDTVNVYWKRVDAVSAANFALEAVKKDYDITLSSKTIDADLLTANNVDTTANPDATCLADGYPMTALTCISLNQSRQVSLLKGHDNIDLYPYGDFAYNFFTTMLDSVIEVTFYGDDTVYEVHRATGNEVTPDESKVQIPSGKELLGWAFSADATEVEIGAVTYAAVESKAVDGKITLYPVFGSYDLYVLIWGNNSSAAAPYVTEAEFNTIKDGFYAYIDANGIDITGKNIVFDYFECKGTEPFQLMLSRSYVHVAVGAAALSNDTYAQYWTYDSNYYAKVTNVTLANTARYVALRGGAAEAHPLAVEFFKYMCESKLEVTVKSNKDGVADVVTVLSSLSDTVANVPELDESQGAFLGWTTVQGGAEVQVGSQITYAMVAAYAVDGKVTLYPVFGSYDLYVLIWGLNPGNDPYVTEDEFAMIKSGFYAYLEAKEIDVAGKNIVIEYFEGKTADFQSMLTRSYIDVAMGASALSNSTYANYWTYDSNYYAKVSNVTLANTSRYVALRDGAAEARPLSVELFKYLCVDETVVEPDPDLETYDLSVLIWGQNGKNSYVTTEEFDMIESGFYAYLQEKGIDVSGKKINFVFFEGNTDAFKEELVKPYVDVAIGAAALIKADYTDGWVVDSNYSGAVVNVTLTNNNRNVGTREGVAPANELAVEFYNYLCVKAPVVTDPDTETYDLVVYVLSGNSKDYDKMSQAVVESLVDMFNEYMKAQGIEGANYNIKVVAMTAKAAEFNEAVNGAGNVDVVISSKAAFGGSYGFAGYYQGETNAEVTGVVNDGRYVGITSSCTADHYELAKKFVEFLTATEA